MTAVASSTTRSVLVLSRCSSTFGPSRGGVDVLARRHARLLAKGHPVIFVGVEELDQPGVRSITLPPRDLVAAGGRGLGYLANEAFHVVRGALEALRVQRRTTVDVVLSNSSLSTLLLKGLAPRPVIHYVHDALIPSKRRGHGVGSRRLTNFVINGVLESWAIRRADSVICPSRAIAAQARAAGAAEARITVMYPLLPTSPPSPQAPAQADPAAQVPAEPFLLSVGQQTGRKRFDLLIRAMPNVPRPMRLVLVGDGPVARSYPPLARALGVADRVSFLPRVDDAGLDALYRSCEAYVLASENEGFPITVAEALSHGRPAVLACPAIDPAELPFDGDALAVVTELDASTIAEAICRILSRAQKDPQAARGSILATSRQAFPTDDQLRREYDRIIRSLV